MKAKGELSYFQQRAVRRAGFYILQHNGHVGEAFPVGNVNFSDLYGSEQPFVYVVQKVLYELLPVDMNVK